MRTTRSVGPEHPDLIPRAEHRPHRRHLPWSRRRRRGIRSVVRRRSERPLRCGCRPRCNRLVTDPCRRSGYSWVDPSYRSQKTQVNITSASDIAKAVQRMHQRRVDLASAAHRSLLDDLDAACPVIDATAIHHLFTSGDALDTVTQCLALPWRQALTQGAGRSDLHVDPQGRHRGG